MSIKLDKQNVRNHPECNKEAIRKSLANLGAGRSVLLDSEDVLIAGNGVYEQAELLGIPIKIIETNGQELIAVKRTDLRTDDEKRKALAIADNRLTDLSEFNTEALDKMLESMSVEMQELAGYAADPSDMLNDGLTDEDEIPEDPEPVCKLGDLWLLGEHRLLCGDSTDKDTVKRLMDGNKADMVFTDPPYNVNYGSSKNPRHKIRAIENDSMSTDEWSVFCHKIYEVLQQYNNGDIYMWGASGPEGMRMRLWLTEVGCHWSATIIWKKQQLVLTPANYQRKYEPCFYGWFNKSSFINHNQSGGDRSETEVWEIDRPLSSKLHPTMKPVELCERGINNSSIRGNIVFDGFLGSGSTLIACEKTGRKCYGMELDPHYCDVIIERWENYTGEKAVKV